MNTLFERNLNLDKFKNTDIFENNIVLEIHHDGDETQKFFYRLEDKKEWSEIGRLFCNEIQSGTNFMMQPCNMREVSDTHIICDTKSTFRGTQYAKR
jgi:hypothetical protein